MNRTAVFICAFVATSFATLQAADPISFREISMLLRNGEDQHYIINDTARRKLLQPLTADELQTLQSLRASPALINLLRDPATVASAQTAAAYAARVEQQKAQAVREQQLAEQAAANARLQQQQQLAQQQQTALTKNAGSSAEAGSPYVGKPITLKFTTADGAPFDIEKLRGKVVLVDFWATWCGPCMKEVPNVVAAYEKYRSKGFEIVGISLDKDKDTMLRITKQKGMTWPQYFDGKGWSNEVSTKFGIRSIPAMWLVDKKGFVVSTDARGGLEEEVARLLAQ